MTSVQALLLAEEEEVRSQNSSASGDGSVACDEVPDHPTAKLMYYLKCVSTVLELPPAPAPPPHSGTSLFRLTNYRQYYVLSQRETDALVTAAIMYAPDQLTGKVFINSADVDSGNNEFLDTDQVASTSRMSRVPSMIQIGNVRRRVLKVMLMGPRWTEQYYSQPLASFQDRMIPITRMLATNATSALGYGTFNDGEAATHDVKQRRNLYCIIGLIVTFFIVCIIIVGIYVGITVAEKKYHPDP